MLTYADCLDFSALTEEEIAVIRDHEHLSVLVAMELGETLLATDDGTRRLVAMIRDEIEAAERHGDPAHAEKLRNVLGAFRHKHHLDA